MGNAGGVDALLDQLVALGADRAAARPIATALAADHGRADRRYHDLDHVRAVLAEVARLLPHEPSADGDAVRLAAWFHDVVYDPTAPAGQNEAASAARARTELTGLGLSRPSPDEVARLVRLTAGHRVEADDRSGAVLVDADLSILAAKPATYDRYAASVRSEYAHVPEDAWRLGRTAVLTHFLDQLDACFTAGPPDDGDRRRAAARANLLRERDALAEGSTG